MLFRQYTGDVFEAPPADQVANCTPWHQSYDGRRTMRLTSGMRDMAGTAVVFRNEAGHPSVGASMKGILWSDQGACPGDTSRGRGSLSPGRRVDDPHPEDPGVATCVPPDGWDGP